MIRTALQPKWLAALLVAVVFAVICGLLGNWQLEEARAEGRAQAIERAAAMPVSPITEIVQPQSAFPAGGSTRPVTATGVYVPEHQVLIADRRLEGQPGFWVLTPLVVDATGASLPVLRGFVSDLADAPPPPAGEIALTGALAPGESPTSEAGLPDGVLRSIDLSILINQWDTTVYNAFVFATDEASAGGPVALDGLQRVPPPTGEASELNLKNAMYALQWWVFAAFGFFLWWRAVRQAHHEQQNAAGANTESTSTADDTEANNAEASNTEASREPIQQKEQV